MVLLNIQFVMVKSHGGEKMYNRKIVLENGEVFKGRGFGLDKEVIADFTIIKDVYNYEAAIEEHDNLILFTYPLIGNYGISKHLNKKAKAIICREVCQKPNQYQMITDLKTECEKQGIVGIEFVDTRALAKILYKHNLKAIICSIDKDEQEAIKQLKGE